MPKEIFEMVTWGLGAYLLFGFLTGTLATMAADFAMKHAPDQFDPEHIEAAQKMPKREMFSLFAVQWPQILFLMAFGFFRALLRR